MTSAAQSGTLNQTLTFAYNSDFKVKSLTYAGSANAYTYDNDNLLTGFPTGTPPLTSRASAAPACSASLTTPPAAKPLAVGDKKSPGRANDRGNNA